MGRGLGVVCPQPAYGLLSVRQWAANPHRQPGKEPWQCNEDVTYLSGGYCDKLSRVRGIRTIRLVYNESNEGLLISWA